MTPAPLVLFDGPCHLCQKSVRFILRYETAAQLQFCALQSSAGQEKIKKHHLPATTDALVLIENGRVHTASDAAFRICGYLRFPWRLLAPLRHLPGWLHRPLYFWIARHRYRWFGKDETCPLPAAGQAERFL